jgi:hypothetical protein
MALGPYIGNNQALSIESQRDGGGGATQEGRGCVYELLRPALSQNIQENIYIYK